MAGSDYRQVLTDKLIEQLEAGTAPWQKPWDARENDRLPYNPTTGAAYRGANSLYLSAVAAEKNYSDPRWATFNQASEQGWKIRKGEKGSLVEYWKFKDTQPEVDAAGNPVIGDDGKPKTIEVVLDNPRVFRAVVFNAQQMEGVPELSKAPRMYDWNPIDRAEQIMDSSGAKVFHDQNDRAYYTRSKDEIHLPPRDQFKDQSAYYSTALHELGHWTGHESRLNREFGESFGSPQYAKEELKAELASYFLADKLGIPHEPEQHAAYVGSWITALKEDKNEIFLAAREAEKITEYVLSLDRERIKEIDVSKDVARESPSKAGHGVPATSVSERAVAEVSEARTPLDVPFSEKEAAKALGAKWDSKPETKGWYAPPGTDLTPLKKWVKAPELSEAKSLPERSEPARSEEKKWLAVPYADKDKAREAGAKWDTAAKAWYAPPESDVSKLSQWLPKNEVAQEAEKKQSLSFDKNSVVDEFKSALEAAGLELKDLPVMDGKLHRVPVKGGKVGSFDGAYIGHLDGVPSGFIQNYKDNVKENWTYGGVQLSQEERAQLAAQSQIVKAQRAAEISEKQSSTAERSQAKWERLSDSSNGENAYLTRKGVIGYGVKYDGEKLVVPLRDIDNKIWSLQSISPVDGAPKMFEKGGKKTGNMHVLGEIKKGADILVAEGYATGASLHEATGKAVAVAFDSGNLDPVVAALKERYPTNPIYIMGDNDKHQQQNVGVEKAMAAAEKHQVGVAFPAFKAEGKLSDFNDLHQKEGIGEVKAQVEKALSVSMEKSRSDAETIAKQQLGDAAEVKSPGSNTRHTGEVLGVSTYHATQSTGRNAAVVHAVADLDQRPSPGKVATIQYKDGKGKVQDRSVEPQKQLQR